MQIDCRIWFNDPSEPYGPLERRTLPAALLSSASRGLSLACASKLIPNRRKCRTWLFADGCHTGQAHDNDERQHKACWACFNSKLARCSELVCNVVKRWACVLADAGNSSQANNDNEGQHNGVLNRCWSIFTLQETFDLHGEILHFYPPTGISVLPNVNNKKLIPQNSAWIHRHDFRRFRGQQKAVATASVSHL